MAMPNNMLELQKLLANIVVVNGDSITFDFTDVLIKDNIFQINANDTHDMNTGTSGFAIDRLTNDQVLFLWDEAVKAFQLKEGTNLTDLHVKDLTINTIAGATSTEVGYLSGVTSNIQDQLNAAGGAPSLSSITDWPTTVDATEVSYLDGVTSNIQEQINAAGGSPSISSITDWPATVDATEVSYLDGVTSSIQTQINSVVADLSTETTNRTNADTTLQSNIDAEAATRLANDNTLQTNINTEATTRANADTTLQANIDTEEAARIAQDDVIELGAGLETDGTYLANATSNYLTTATSLKNADDTLDTALKTEETTRITNDNTLQSNIDTEAATRLANDNTLQSNIDTEASTRLANDNTLQSNIDTEASTRATADTNLENTKVAKAGDTMTGSLLVDANNAYDLGTETDRWKTANFRKTSTGWKDLVAQPTVPKNGLPGTVPLYMDIGNGIYAYSYTDEFETVVHCTYHILHDIKVGSYMYPHVHWSPSSNHTGTVRWKIEYTSAKGHAQNEALTNAVTTVYVEQAAKGLPGEHMVAEVSTQDAFLAPEVDSIVVMSISRDVNHANDTYYGNVFLHLVDLHYEADRVSTLNKAPDFYGGLG